MQQVSRARLYIKWYNSTRYARKFYILFIFNVCKRKQVPMVRTQISFHYLSEVPGFV